MNHFDHAVLMREAAAVKRYHTRRTLRQQTVGEHSFGAIQLLHQVYPEARKEVLLAMVYHDLPELVTGDVPAPVKRQSPKLAELLNAAEKQTGPLHQDFDLSMFEEAVCKWCDLMELVLWCLEEVRLGNQYAKETCLTGLLWLWDAPLVLRHSDTGVAATAVLLGATRVAQETGVKIEIPQLKEST